MAVAITAFKDNKIEKNMQDLFQDLIVDGYISPESKTLCVDTPTGSYVSALREIGVSDAVGISKKASKSLVISSDSRRIPFGNNSFDFVFSGDGALEKSPNPSEFAVEITRTLKPEGFAAFHVMAKHTYSSNSFVDLFKFCCKVVKVNDIEGFDSSMPHIREIVVKKEGYGIGGDSDFGGKCSVPRYKQELVKNAEPLIEEEPLKPYNNMPSVWKLFDKMPENYRAFVHWCVDEGMEEGEFSEGREDLVYRDNVALIVTGTLYERDVQELPEKMPPTGHV
ncbi:Tubulin/FtsZ, C-terminal [Sesbania bispinosa]|nr:Tubulin/FtsZ, C-terminal [Sesbania bispinosa]